MIAGAAKRTRTETHLALSRLINTLSGSSWVFLWRGIFALIFCASTLFVGALVAPFLLTSIALASLVIIFGFFAFWSGMVELIAYAKSGERASVLLLIDGLVGTGMCIFAINFPQKTAASIPLLLGLYVLLLALFEAVVSLRLHRKLASRGLAFALCALIATLGLYLVRMSEDSVRSVAMVSIAALCIGALNLEIGRQFRLWHKRFETTPSESLGGRLS